MIDTIVTIATPDWADAAVVWAHDVRAYMPEHKRAVVLSLGDMPEHSRAKCVAHGAEVLRAEDVLRYHAPWPIVGRNDVAFYWKLAIIGAEWLGNKAVWLDVDTLILESMAGLEDFEDFSATEAWGATPPGNCGTAQEYKPELQTGLFVFRPDRARLAEMLDYSRGLARHRCAPEQHLISCYMWAREPDRVNLIGLDWHLNTRCMEFNKHKWTETQHRRLLHFAGPAKPWHSRETPLYGETYNLWRERANAIGLGPYALGEEAV